MADYDINGTIFYNAALLHRTGARVKSKLAHAWLGLVDPPVMLQDRLHIRAWNQRLVDARQQARAGVVHALVVKPGRLAARVEDPVTKEMHAIKVNVPMLDALAWTRMAAQISGTAEAAAQLVNGILPESLLPDLMLSLLNLPNVAMESDGIAQTLDQMPDPLLITPWLVFAERVDADPWLWVLLRGQTQDGLLDLIRQHSRAQAQAQTGPARVGIDVAFTLESFWRMGDIKTKPASIDEKSPMRSRLAHVSPGLRVGRRALSAMLREAYS